MKTETPRLLNGLLTSIFAVCLALAVIITVYTTVVAPAFAKVASAVAL
ncbi:MAG: hypothetical protein WKF79_00230 [Nocardioides sp.]